MFIYGDEVDRRLSWKPGRAEQLARQRRLPHVILPDGSIRFAWEDIEPLIVRVPSVPVCESGGLPKNEKE